MPNMLVSGGGALVLNGVSALQKGLQRTPFLSITRTTKKVPSRHHIRQHLVSGLLSLQNCEKLLFISLPI
jgi:hypothetical protein